MTARLVLIVVTLLSLARPVLAHRLDEYLQAATIEVGKDSIAIELRLTPGVSVARQVLSSIDTDGDGLLSEAEQRSYAAQVRQDLSLMIDGRPDPLRLVSSSFPAAEQLVAGVGDISLLFEADAPSASSNHRLTFETRHESAIAVYLVNALLPKDPGIHIVSQERNYNQSSYDLVFAMDAAPTSGRAQNLSGDQQHVNCADRLSVVATYFWHGVHHILTSYDHLLFIGALVLGALTLWDLLKVVTAFTVAHSITLTLAALNLVHLPDALVEPLISASIVFVALQNVFWPKQSRGGSRLAVAFFFGLFHGLGFAGGLIEVMHLMPTEMILLAIAGFSLGVEAGNQLILLPLFAALNFVHRKKTGGGLRRHALPSAQQVGSIVISVAGLFYLILAIAEVL